MGPRRLHDRLRLLPPPRRPRRRPDRSQARLPRRPRRLHRRLGALRPRRDAGRADRGALHPGPRRRDRVVRDPRADRHRVPRDARARGGHERLHVRRLQRRLDRPAGRRLADRGAQLALDLLHQPPDRRGRVRARPDADRGVARARAAARRRLARRGADDRRDDARGLRDRQGRRLRLGLGAHARLRRSGPRAARRLRGARGAPAGSDLPPTDPAGARPHGEQRRARLPDHRHVLDVRARLAVPGARARLRRAADRARVPADDARARRALGRARRRS